LWKHDTGLYSRRCPVENTRGIEQAIELVQQSKYDVSIRITPKAHGSESDHRSSPIGSATPLLTPIPETARLSPAISAPTPDFIMRLPPGSSYTSICMYKCTASIPRHRASRSESIS
jgi:hypothetical protein